MDEKQNSKKWSSASLRIFSETMLPEDVEAVLGLKASRTHRNGERRSPRNNLVWHESAWLLHSPIGKARDLPDHLEWLLNITEPKRDAIRSLSVNCRIVWFRP
jgi:Domain of unknown function (DUF4279)